MKEAQADFEEFTVGICATGESPALIGLAASLLEEKETRPSTLRKLVVVASACPVGVVSGLRELRREDDRLDLVIEDSRRGKADAVNKILARTLTPILMMVNSDSIPEAGAFGKLLASALSDKSAGAISALPMPDRGRGPASLLTDFMWSAHNKCSIALNHLNLSNHSSDELVLFRSDAIAKLPPGLVNDGAFLAAVARMKGYTVKVCPSARVVVRTSNRISEVLLQRRRILFGHAQVWRKMGAPPKTVESLFFISPFRGLKLLVSTLSERPRFVLVLPIALVSETAAAVLSILDSLRASEAHAVWRRMA